MKLTRKQIEQLIQDTSLDHKGKNLYGKCPKCGHNEFGISLEDNHRFNCFRKKECGFQGNIYTLLKFLGKIKEFLSEREINIFEKLNSSFHKQEEKVEQLPEVTPPLFWKRIYENDYLYARGFRSRQFEKFEVGCSMLRKDYITFLVRMNGVLVGYVSRSIKDKSWIDAYNKKQKESGGDLVYLRYDNSRTDFAKCLFGYDEIVEGVTKDVILVEGIFDKIKTDDNLFLDDSDDFKCCATFGAKLSDPQIELLKNKGVENIWLWFESDVLRTVKDVAARASLHFNVKVCYISGDDPGDWGVDEAASAITNSKDWVDFYYGYVKSKLK